MTKLKFFFLLILFVSLSGCNLFLKKSDKDDEEPNKTLISYEKLTTFSITENLIDQVLNSDSLFNDKILQNHTRFSVNVYKVIYRTIHNGVEKRASGACVIPNTDEALPVLSYQHGTIFLNSDAPSQFTDILNINIEMALNVILASCGYVCSAPDYLGYGESRDMMHPYHHAPSLAIVSLDMLKAVKELCKELNVNIKDEYFLAGYSEGGYATLALQKEITTKHSTQFPIKAVSAGAGAYDLISTARQFMREETLRNPPFTCFLFVSYNETYGWGRDLSEFFNSPYSQRIGNGMFAGDRSYNQINSQLTSDIDQLFTPGFLNAFRGDGEINLKNALDTNNLYKGWIPQVPTRLYHGLEDKTVPPSNSETAENAFIIGGAPYVYLYLLKGRTHSTGTFPWAKGTIQWFNNY